MILAASFFENVGGVKTLILLLLIALIAWYLHRLSAKEKTDTAEVLTKEKLDALPDETLVNEVIRAMLADCDQKRPDPYRMTAVWSNAQVNVYSVWAVTKEAEADGLAAVTATPTAPFLPLAADGFAQIGAAACAAAVTAQQETPGTADEAFAAAAAAEQPLTRCVAYIRDNAEAFVKVLE